MKTVLPDEIQIMKSLSDDDFDNVFAREVKAEAKQSMRVVYFIREANRRKHWLKKFSNLAKYCAHHGISNGDFYRKLAITNTIREIPEVEEKIIKGTLNPSTVAQVNTFCRSETKNRAAAVSVEEKRELLCKIEGLSAKVVERELAKISPKSAIPDRKRQIAEDLFANQFTSDQSLENKLDRLRELLSNALPSAPTQNDLLHKICDVALKKLEVKSTNEKMVRPASTRSRYISSITKRKVRQRDGDQCTFVLESGQKCGSRINLNFDHILPYAKGGSTSAENLRQVCRNHNHFLAIQEYGRDKISQYA